MQTPEYTRSCNVVRHKRLRPRDTEALPITVLHYATNGDAGKQRQVPTRHRVSCTATVSLGHPAEIHYGASPPRRGPPLPPHKVSLPLHTKSEGHTTNHKDCVPQQDFSQGSSR